MRIHAALLAAAALLAVDRARADPGPRPLPPPTEDAAPAFAWPEGAAAGDRPAPPPPGDPDLSTPGERDGGTPRPWRAARRWGAGDLGPGVAVPFWWGWDWGWGYYPLWSAPPYPDSAPRVPDRSVTSLRLSGAGSATGTATGFAFGLEGRRLGLALAFDGFSIGGRSWVDGLDSTTVLGVATAHLTYAVVDARSLRLRAELGVSALTVPTGGSYAGEPYAGAISFGPDLGASLGMGLAGPVGLEGHARWTPLPVSALDLAAALAVRGGPLGLTAGWRWFDLAGSGRTGPAIRFTGPEVGVDFLF